MAAKLTTELADAVRTSSSSGLEVIDPSTNRIYVILDEETHRRAMEALRQQEDDWAAIQQGIGQADAGGSMSLADSEQQIREQFGFAPRS